MSNRLRLAGAWALAAWLLGAGPAAAQRAVVVDVPVGAIAGSAVSAGAGAVAAALGVQSLSLGPALPAASLASPALMPAPSAPPAPAGPASPAAGPAGPSGVPAVPAARALRLAVLGPPGVGKGTFGKRIAAEYGVVHISVGELLRERAKSDPAMAAVMARGQLLDSQLVLGVVRERLSKPDVLERGFLLDGFPRRMVEAQALEEWLGRDRGLDAVVHLEAPSEELERRILSRGRADDNHAVFLDRMELYRRQTLPVLEHLRRRVPVLEPDVSGRDLEVNWDNVRRALERFEAD